MGCLQLKTFVRFVILDTQTGNVADVACIKVRKLVLVWDTDM